MTLLVLLLKYRFQTLDCPRPPEPRETFCGRLTPSTPEFESVLTVAQMHGINGGNKVKFDSYSLKVLMWKSPNLNLLTRERELLSKYEKSWLDFDSFAKNLDEY